VGRLAAVLALATVVLAAGCGSQSQPKALSSSLTIEQMLKVPGPNVAITMGAGSFVPGSVRFPFMVIRNDARPVNAPTARIWIAGGKDKKPFAQATARLQRIGISGVSAPAAGGVTRIYVARLQITRPGRYWLVAQPAGRKIKGVSVFDVRAKLPVPAVGAKAPVSRTPTLGSEPLSKLTTSDPPDRPLLRYSVAASLAAHKPFVVTFATPKYCTSRVCGPVVDVVEAVQRKLASSDVRFIHVEVYTDNNPTKGYNRWMRQWGLTTEPWTFLVGRDGRIKAEFEGSVAEDELANAVKSKLL
jgi:hypothetical protein